MRLLARLRAWLFGWFWLPCPICGRMFAGFEWGGTLYDAPRDPAALSRRGEGVCPRHPGDYVRIDGEIYEETTIG